MIDRIRYHLLKRRVTRHLRKQLKHFDRQQQALEGIWRKP